MKKSLSLAISLIMIIASLTALPFTAQALDSSGTCGVNVNYTFDSETGALVISGKGAINDYGTNSNKSPFNMATGVKSIEIKEGVKGIGNNAFYLCPNAASITIPASVESIGVGAFRQCYHLKSVIIPDGINDIEESAFYYCNRLERVVLPASVVYIGPSAFTSCGNLKAILYKNDESHWGAISISDTGNEPLSSTPIVFNVNDATFSGTCVNEITGDKTYYSYDMDTGTMTISGKGEMADFEKPSDSPFYANAAINTVIIKKGIETIGEYAFAECTGLEDVIIAEGTLTTIGWESFYNCTGLKTINIPDSVIYFSDETFDGASDTFTITASCEKASVLADYVEGTNRVWNKTHPCRDYVTKATLSKNGTVVNRCACGDVVNSTKTIIRPKTIKLSATNYTHNGKVKKPKVTVKDSKGKTIAAKNYTVTYAKGRKNIGKYAVKIKFKGNYSGTKTLSFNINPKGTSISKITGGKKKFTVKWKKQTKLTSGYQIIYSPNKSFGIYYPYVTVKGNKKTKKTVTNISESGTYYVKIRTYKTVKGKKYYSKWSEAVKVKVK
ncbi:MAG: leucine-rich repeat domain-containing protein [Eubacterium sp.]|nr:leucine-rich repeat domain-containing protein [Eubacterium sp.]